MKGRLFVSYASDERSLAEPIAQALRNAGFKVFLDRNDLPPGGDYVDRISTAIEGCDALIFLISPSSVEAGRYTLTELDVAARKWPSPVGRILPVMVIDTPLASVPVYLKSLTLMKPHGSLAAETVAAVKRLRGWRRQALRWYALSGAAILTALVAGGIGADRIVSARTQTSQRSVALEVRSNTVILSELAKNTQTLGQAMNALARSIRHPDIAILSGLFPIEDLSASEDTGQLANLHNERMDWLATSGLLTNQLELQKATAACGAVSAAIDRTRTVVNDLVDAEGDRYTLKRNEWDARRQSLVRSLGADAGRVATFYDRSDQLSLAYNRLGVAAESYLDALRSFCSSGTVTRQSLGATLAAERLAFMIYTAALQDIETSLRESTATLNLLKADDVLLDDAPPV
jgi:methylmalonyl-CoA mutase cobalamin-binding subunit